MNAKENYNFTCPRCLGAIPTIMAVGMYPGALSRADNKTEICSDCGTEEAMLNLHEIPLQMPGEWPVTKDMDADNDAARERCGMWLLKQEFEIAPEALEAKPRRHPSIGNAE